MSIINVKIHAVWAVKKRQRLLTPSLRSTLLSHIIDNARSKSIYIDRINGYTDHIHCLFSIKADMTIAKAIMLMKGESTYWVNKQNLLREKLEWAHGYYAASVSDCMIEIVRRYIERQELHHQLQSFHQKVEEILALVELEA